VQNWDKLFPEFFKRVFIIGGYPFLFHTDYLTGLKQASCCRLCFLFRTFEQKTPRDEI